MHVLERALWGAVADRWEGGTGGKNTSKWPNLGQPGDMEVKDRGG